MRIALLIDVKMGDTEDEDLKGNVADALSGIEAEEGLALAVESTGYVPEELTVLDFYVAYGSGEGLKNLRKLGAVR